MDLSVSLHNQRSKTRPLRTATYPIFYNLKKQKPPGWTSGGFGTHKDYEFIGLPASGPFIHCRFPLLICLAAESLRMSHRGAECEEEPRSNQSAVNLGGHAGHCQSPQNFISMRGS
jgi:hypothetical protein